MIAERFITSIHFVIVAQNSTNCTDPIDVNVAREQHNSVCCSLRSLGVDVLELPPDEASPESVFTQDLAVVVNDIALMCRPGPHRQAEV